jgi:leucine dehydrogenase
MNTPLDSFATPSLFGLPSTASSIERPHERVLLVADAQSGLRTILAVHSTARGPAFGGCRMWTYANDQEALTDALRLSQGMSLKNALADLPFGGGKAVILRPHGDFDRTALFRAFGEAVESLAGRYITAEDVGSTTEDMRMVQSQTRYVSGIPRDGHFGGDPSPKTAYGVFVSIDEAVRRHLGRDSLAGVTVAVQGLGAVGSALCAFLHEAGAKLVVADVNEARVQAAKHRYGASVVSVERILFEPVDVLAPCALGAVLNPASVDDIRAQIVAGAANNQLASLVDGDRLQARGILYLPDFLVNAGGIVSVAREYLGTGDEASVMTEVGRIRNRVSELLDRMKDSKLSPARIAQNWAQEKIVRAA